MSEIVTGMNQSNIQVIKAKPTLNYRPDYNRQYLPHLREVYITSNNVSDITVLDRLSMPYTLDKNSDAIYDKTPAITIVSKYSFFGKEAMSKTIMRMETYHRHKKVTEPSFHMILGALKKHMESNRPELPLEFQLARVIEVADLKASPGIYDQDSDLLFCYGDSWMELRHPFCYDQISRVDNTHIQSSKKVSGSVIEVVDNDGTIGAKYFNLYGEVCQVTPGQDSMRKQGVYLTKFDSRVPAERTSAPELLTPQEAKERRILFDTIEEARTLGDPSFEFRLREEELRTRVQEIKLSDAEVAVENQKLKADIGQKEHDHRVRELALKTEATERQAVLEREKSELEKQNELLSLEAARRKDYYESRSTERKDSSELFKYGVGIVVGVLGAASAIFATRKT